MSGPGHNGGPTMAAGAGWRRYAWRRARRELLATLPIEVVRLRLKRARDLGIDYKSYASIRAATGRDIVALLFSSNALRLGPRLVAVPGREAGKLRALTGAERLAAVYPPLTPAAVTGANAALIEAAMQAPTLADGWADTRARLLDFTTGRGLAPDSVVVIGDTGLEAQWATAGRMAGYLEAAAYFAGSDGL